MSDKDYSKKIKEYEEQLLEGSTPIAQRCRLVFLLKQIGTVPALKVIAKAMYTKSVLLAHEAAYCLGQSRTTNTEIIELLLEALCNMRLDPITRHEAAEALGALGGGSDPEQSQEVFDTIKRAAEQEPLKPGQEVKIKVCTKGLSPQQVRARARFPAEVVDTCKIAVERLAWVKKRSQSQKEESKQQGGEEQQQSKSSDGSSDYSGGYQSVDPAPPFPPKQYTVEELQAILCDTKQSLFQRYRAMFALRNIGSKEAVLAMGASLKNAVSPVFRHEVAFVFGQMRSKHSVPFLKELLADTKEHAMVRHEAAEAMGSVLGEGGDDAKEVLGPFLKDEQEVVRESCEVALDISEFWQSDEVSSAISQ